MWLMILIAVAINDPKDIPAKVMIEFPDQLSCEQSLRSMNYWVKFDSFCYFPNCAHISAADGAAKIFSYLLCRGVIIIREKMVSLVIQTHVSRVALDWDLPDVLPTELPRRGYRTG